MKRYKNRYLVEFSGEHPALPLEELKSAAEACGEKIEEVEVKGRLSVVEAKEIRCAVSRCALLHSVALQCVSSIVGDTSGGLTRPSEELKEKGREIRNFIHSHYPKAETYRLTIRKVGGRFPGVEQNAIIHGLAKGIDMRVSLKEPDIKVVVYIVPSSPSSTSTPRRLLSIPSKSPPSHSTPLPSSSIPSMSPSSPSPSPSFPAPLTSPSLSPASVSPALYFGILLHESSRSDFGKRAVKNRPFFSPISLHPVLARTVVNLSRVGHGGVILDPFCGTGGILMEASLLGLSAVGADRDSEMLRGAEMNLRHFDAEALLLNSDVGALPDILREHGITMVDGIATDLPYGRASTTFGEDKSELYLRAFETFKAVLKPGGYAAVVLPGALPGIDGLRLVSFYSLRVHRSLTRHFTVYRRL